MQRNKVVGGLAGLAVAGGAAAALLLSPAGPAVGQSSAPLQLEIHVNSPATLVAKGAGADVSVTTQCSGAPSASASVTLTERVGKGIASGFASAEVGCTGASQTVTILVTAEAGGKAFDKSTAIAQGVIEACSPFTCGTAQDQETITIK